MSKTIGQLPVAGALQATDRMFLGQDAGGGSFPSKHVTIATLDARFQGGTSAIGFFGATPVAKQASGANLTNNVTAGGADTDTIDDFAVTVAETVAVGASTADVNARLTSIRNDIYRLSRKLKQVNDALRLYGLLD